jgi:hypothetical protein
MKGVVSLQLGIEGRFITEDGWQRRATDEDVQKFFGILQRMAEAEKRQATEKKRKDQKLLR